MASNLLLVRLELSSHPFPKVSATTTSRKDKCAVFLAKESDSSSSFDHDTATVEEIGNWLHGFGSGGGGNLETGTR